MSAATSPFAPFRLAGLPLRNRVIKAATFEGMTPGAQVSAGLIEHHRELAAGGVAMTTVAYCAVSPDGRTFADQLYMRAEVVPALRRLTDAVHREGAAASLQLGHCGAFCNNRQLGRRRPIGPSRAWNPVGALQGRPWADAMSDADIEQTQEDFVQAARLAREAGFDAVELHLGHGYLLSQFLCPATNGRRDGWGGSLANRARLPLAVVTRVRAALPPQMPVLAKINLRDGFTGGLELPESVQIASWLQGCGASALVLSGGFVSRDAFYLFRGSRPLRQMIEVEKSWAQKLALLLLGPTVIREYPFEPLYFLPLANEVRRAVTMPLILVGGVKSLDDIETALGHGFELVAMGRALLHDPALIAKYQAGAKRTSGCIPCNQCVAEMDRAGGVRCARVPEQLAQRDSYLRSLRQRT
jgi:2,4-dienoyl-CoA reductase-like NADH-dependent reductase (Old Yellow Enzyme family)